MKTVGGQDPQPGYSCLRPGPSGWLTRSATIRSGPGQVPGRVIAVLVIAMALAARGFKLRGQADLPFESIYIETGGFSLLAAELRRVIRTGSKTRIAEQPNDAQVILRIVGEQQEKHVLSLSTAGRSGSSSCAIGWHIACWIAPPTISSRRARSNSGGT